MGKSGFCLRKKPFFYTHKRMGKNGKTFKMIKLMFLKLKRSILPNNYTNIFQFLKNKKF